MKNIENNQLLNNLISLKLDETIFIEIDKDICNRIKLIDFQKVSYENLFTAYINKTIDPANEFNLQKFLDLYTEINIKQHDIVVNEFIKIVGLDCYKYIISNNIKYIIMYDINRIKIFR